MRVSSLGWTLNWCACDGVLQVEQVSNCRHHEQIPNACPNYLVDRFVKDLAQNSRNPKKEREEEEDEEDQTREPNAG